MTEEEKGKSEAGSEKEQPETQTPESTDKPSEEPTGDNLPEGHKFKGKTAEDIAKAYDALEGKLGEQANRLAFYEMTEGQRTGGRPNPEAVQTGYEPAQPEPSLPQNLGDLNDEDYVTGKDVKNWFQSMGMNWQKQDAKARQVVAAVKPFIEQAKKDNPYAFRNVSDNELDGTVYDYVVKGGDPRLINSVTVAQAAASIQIGKTGKLTTPTVDNPVSAPYMETPVGNKPVTKDKPSAADVPAGIKDMWERMGLSKEDREAIAQKIAEEDE